MEPSDRPTYRDRMSASVRSTPQYSTHNHQPIAAHHYAFQERTDDVTTIGDGAKSQHEQGCLLRQLRLKQNAKLLEPVDSGHKHKIHTQSKWKVDNHVCQPLSKSSTAITSLECSVDAILTLWGAENDQINHFKSVGGMCSNVKNLFLMLFIQTNGGNKVGSAIIEGGSSASVFYNVAIDAVITAFVDKPPFERIGLWGFARNPTGFNRLLESIYGYTEVIKLVYLKELAAFKPLRMSKGTAFVDKPPFERIGLWGFARNPTGFNRLLESIYSYTEVIKLCTTTNPPLRTTTLHNNALMMSPRLVMKRLQSNCPAQRTSQRPPSSGCICDGLRTALPNAAVIFQ
ncbi:hypothetical protein T265_10606 [Opisthorchis viverrini]|uniref:Uncharacterized protein n=1 Tax=Opisthorchis viverrini TaxID=6198 RepID=A0A075A0K0_OPIVI|nr:hypothetical protein T265_10606 [Opisthorchis viverrini]KER20949.1 hypothetical protein T265_10606 [Opisthorchis viverrini]